MQVGRESDPSHLSTTFGDCPKSSNRFSHEAQASNAICYGRLHFKSGAYFPASEGNLAQFVTGQIPLTAVSISSSLLLEPSGFSAPFFELNRA